MALNKHSPCNPLLQPQKSFQGYDTRVLCMLEMMLGAGYSPSVYHNVVVPPEPHPVAVLDPLKDRPSDFFGAGGAHTVMSPGSYTAFSVCR